MSYPILSQGSFMAISIDIPNSKAILKTIARTRPILVAFFCWCSGSLLDAIEMNMMLSTPRTISKNVNVRRLIQTVPLPQLGMSKRRKLKFSMIIASYLVLIVELQIRFYFLVGMEHRHRNFPS